jgi:photosystem II stability/assembly factor-like uncharacterized protein
MVILSEGARSGRSINSQCGTTNYRSFVATSEGNELWELCLGNPNTEVAAGSPDPSMPPSMNATQTTADKVLYVSQDGGVSWSQTRGPLPMLGVSVSIVSTGPHQLLLGTDSTPILRSTDGAAHWSPVQTSPAGVQWIRFINLQTGWAMDRQGAIWSTTDGGLTWSKLPDL